ncbi:DUF2938 domain-containing protein [Acidisoma sp. C75]
MSELLVRGLIIGLGATILMDLWDLLLGQLPGRSRADWGPVGRWFWHLGRGRVFHPDIRAADAHPQERAFGWIAHYAVGLLYGVIFAFIVGPTWFLHPSFLPAWIWGIVTITAGWFLLLPGMGLGWAGSATPNPWLTRCLGLLAHTVFGFGLYATALIL